MKVQESSMGITLTIRIFIIAIFVFLSGISMVKASSHIALSCQVIDNDIESCNGATVFSLSARTNAHSEIPSQNNYNFKVCCQASGLSMGNSCESGVSVLKLSSPTNAHIEKSTLANYGTDVCLSISSNADLSCKYKTNCDNDEACLATISGDTNAKAADCVTNPYPTKICCNCTGTVSGNVKNTNDAYIDGAKIEIMQGVAIKHTFTQPSGNYQIDNVLCGTYDVKASAEGYVPSTKLNVLLPSDESLTIDFTGNEALVPGTTCQDDCTYAEDNIIHSECAGIDNKEEDIDGDGRTDCSFYDETAEDICNLAQPGWVRDYSITQEIVCAEGAPQDKTEVKATVTCEEDNLIKKTSVVTYKGKLVKIVVVVCG